MKKCVTLFVPLLFVFKDLGAKRLCTVWHFVWRGMECGRGEKLRGVAAAVGRGADVQRLAIRGRETGKFGIVFTLGRCWVQG